MEYRLDELFELQMGKTPSRDNKDYWNSGSNKWVSIADLSKCGKYIQETKECLSDKAIEESGINQIPENTVIMSFKLSIGKTAITVEPMYSNEAIMSFIDKRKVELIPDYIYYMFLKKDWDVGTNNAVMGKTLNKATLSQTKVTIHDIQQQKQIVKILDKVTGIIAARKAELDELEHLVKARFVEMFGDPMSNSMGWHCLLLTEVCEAIFGGGTPSKSHPEYFTGTIPWISPKDMKNSVISDSIDHITEDAIVNSTTNLIPINSVLMVIRSGILKHTLPVAINSVLVTINQDMKAFVPNSAVTPEYLMYYFKAIELDVLSGVRGVTADNIDFKAFQTRMVIVPPIELQNQFSAFVAQTDKSKVVIQKSLDETQLLFDSLMQEFFG